MPWLWMGPHSRIFLGRFHREHTSLLCEVFASSGTVTVAPIHHPEQWEPRMRSGVAERWCAA